MAYWPSPTPPIGYNSGCPTPPKVGKSNFDAPHVPGPEQEAASSSVNLHLELQFDGDLCDSMRSGSLICDPVRESSHQLPTAGSAINQMDPTLAMLIEGMRALVGARKEEYYANPAKYYPSPARWYLAIKEQSHLRGVSAIASDSGHESVSYCPSRQATMDDAESQLAHFGGNNNNSTSPMDIVHGDFSPGPEREQVASVDALAMEICVPGAGSGSGSEDTTNAIPRLTTRQVPRIMGVEHRTRPRRHHTNGGLWVRAVRQFNKEFMVRRFTRAWGGSSGNPEV